MVDYTHGLSKHIHKHCVFFIFFTVAFCVNKHMVYLVKYFLNLSACAHITDLVGLHHCITPSAKIQTLSSCWGTFHSNQPEKEACLEFNMLYRDKTCFSPKQCHSHSPHLLQLHQLVTFSCFYKPSLLSSSPTYKNPPLLFPTLHCYCK